MADPAVELVNSSNEISCVIIPVGAQRILLPNVCVAEIVPWRRVQPLEDAPAWCLGRTGWRGLTIGVVDYNGFAPKGVAMDGPRCLVVMNRARVSHAPSFYAIAATSLPYMVQLGGEDISNDASGLGPADVMRVKVGTETAIIPDLEYLETEVSTVLR